jgi:hypothetical protein
MIPPTLNGTRSRGPEDRLSDTELSALRTELVRLIIQQGTIFTNWVKFAITVQGGLAAQRILARSHLED